MEKSKQFALSHLTLYAKGWYLRTDDIWEDLKKILELDDYSPFSKNDVYSIITSRFSEFEHRSSELRQVLFGIHPSECWKYGYYTKDNEHWFHRIDVQLPMYDMQTAFIYYVLSNLRNLNKTKWNVKLPKYTKYPKSKDITLSKVYEIFVKPKKAA